MASWHHFPGEKIHQLGGYIYICIPRSSKVCKIPAVSELYDIFPKLHFWDLLAFFMFYGFSFTLMNLSDHIRSLYNIIQHPSFKFLRSIFFGLQPLLHRFNCLGTPCQTCAPPFFSTSCQDCQGDFLQVSKTWP